ncbi:hypothetical protein [Burkholderia cepacia]|uniref:hypothetical protein n=1 Tax=Burkholderia cepacia TaxID=292 RepID=UPI0035291922
MKVRVLDAQADLFEVGVVSQTTEVHLVSIDQLLAAPWGDPVLIVGSLLAADQLSDMRRLASALERAQATVIVAPPFSDLDLGCYFETPVQLRAQRRAAESEAYIADGATSAELGDEIKVRSDHFFDTALGAGVIAVDAQGKPVLIRYQATNTAGPVFFSALQLLTYTALTDEGQRQGLLTHLLSWKPVGASMAMALSPGASNPPKADTVSESMLVPVALLLAAGGPQSEDQLRARAQALLGVDLSGDDVRHAVEELNRHGLVVSEGAGTGARSALNRFLEQRGMHPYLRELAALITSEETTT